MPTNYNATVARMAGGPQGAGFGFQGRTQRPKAPAPQQQSGYRPESFGMQINWKPSRYKPENLNRTLYDATYDRGRYQIGREVNANNAYDAALADPRAQAEMYRDFYARSANAISAPILRQFQSVLGSNLGANAARFGGQAGSTEQARGEFNVADVFSRNLAEVIDASSARSVDAGFARTDQLAQRSQATSGALDNTFQLAGQFAQGTKKKGGGIGGFLGGVVGAGAGALLGNPGFGAAAGRRIFGG